MSLGLDIEEFDVTVGVGVAHGIHGDGTHYKAHVERRALGYLEQKNELLQNVLTSMVLNNALYL